MIVGEHTRDTDLDVSIYVLLTQYYDIFHCFWEINKLRLCDRLTPYETRHLQILDLLGMMRMLSCLLRVEYVLYKSFLFNLYFALVNFMFVINLTLPKYSNIAFLLYETIISQTSRRPLTNSLPSSF